jgi:hypothetical protein
MPRGKKELAEQVTPELREVEVEVGRGKTVAQAVKKIGVTEQTYSLGRSSSKGRLVGCQVGGPAGRQQSFSKVTEVKNDSLLKEPWKQGLFDWTISD